LVDHLWIVSCSVVRFEFDKMHRKEVKLHIDNDGFFLYDINSIPISKMCENAHKVKSRILDIVKRQKVIVNGGITARLPP
jgi:hypothetical protein